MMSPLSVVRCSGGGARVTIWVVYAMIFYVSCPWLTTAKRRCVPPGDYLMRTTLILTSLGCLLFTTAAGSIDTVAGTGKAGYAGDGGKATAAQLNQPFHCDLDGKGNLYVAEAFNHCIRKIDLKTGVITTIAGTGTKGYTGDGGPAT